MPVNEPQIRTHKRETRQRDWIDRLHLNSWRLQQVLWALKVVILLAFAALLVWDGHPWAALAAASGAVLLLGLMRWHWRWVRFWW